MSKRQTAITLASRPKGPITSETFKINREAPVPTEADLKDGQILIQVLYISIDPAMRGWLNDVRSYLPPVGIGEVMRAGGIGRVVASRSSKFSKGDHVDTTTGWQEWAVVDAKRAEKIVVPDGAVLTDFLATLGMTGQTAYWGLFDVCKPRPGETVVVSGAAGAVGSLAVQLAKISGCRVIGVAGAEDKCEFLLKELGADVALDYKSPDFRKQFAAATPKYIDCIFENVGGEILDLFLTRLNKGARIALCGSISQYNATTRPTGLQNYLTLISMRAKLQGFIVFDYADRYREAAQKLAGWIGEGKIKRKETKVKGIEKCPEALQGLFKGANVGKMYIDVGHADAHL